MQSLAQRAREEAEKIGLTKNFDEEIQESFLKAFKEGYIESYQKGRKAAKRKIIAEMIDSGFDTDLIAFVTKFIPEEIEELVEQDQIKRMEKVDTFNGMEKLIEYMLAIGMDKAWTLTAKELFKSDIDIGIISQVTGFSPQEVEEIVHQDDK